MTKLEAKKAKIGSRVVFESTDANVPREFGKIVDLNWSAVQVEWDDGETFTYRLDNGASCVRLAI
jgi:hypothetical protein